jgi:hypothetical protein
MRWPSIHFVLHFAPVLAALSFSSVAHSQILLNGSFESPIFGSTQNLAGAFSLGAWSGFGPSNGGNAGLVVGVDNGLGPASGAQHFTFNGGNPSDQGWIEQTFSTVPGTAYLVEFAIGRSGGGQALSLLASVSGLGSLASASFSPAASAGYSAASFAFVADHSSVVLRFSDTSGGNSVSDLYLDSVSVMAAVPEPAVSAVVLGVAAAGLVGWRRRRR